VLPAFARRLLPNDVRFPLYTWILSLPVLADLFVRINPGLRANRVHRRTRLLVDGYPRSANTWTSFAFQELVGHGQVASHLHSSQSIRTAARLGVPCVLLVRDPDEAVASALTFDTAVQVKTAFRAYARYYEVAGKAADKVVVVDFATAVSDFPEVVRRVNARYGTGFSVDRAATLDKEQIFERIDRESKIVADGRDVTAIAPRPHEGRQHRDVAMDDPSWAKERARARAAYELVTKG
jgi:hypothetical protein